MTRSLVSFTLRTPRATALLALTPVLLFAQSADWTQVIWREPQVRYLLADLCFNGGNDGLYRKFATEEHDPDSREAIRLWDAGVRVVNTNEFERKCVLSQYAKDGRTMRIAFHGSKRTITGNEVLLTSDFKFEDAEMRSLLLRFCLDQPPKGFDEQESNSSRVEAIRRWRAGARVLNTNWFEMRGHGQERRPCYKGTETPAQARDIRLNCDLQYPEVNVRYLMADMSLGGSRDFYWRTADVAHEMGCLEAVCRHDNGVKITNLDQFERKKVDGKVVITQKGSNERISGSLVKLSTDLDP